MLWLATAAAARWFTLFGPMLWYEMLRMGRGREMYVLRLWYTAFLLVAVISVYTAVVDKPKDMFFETSYQINQLAYMTSAFFVGLMVMQILAVMLITPTFSGGAVTIEKERRTLEYLLASDLLSREIIFGKVAAGLAFLAILLVSGLPVLGLLQFLGGIEMEFILLGFATTFVTMISLSCLSVVVSVYARTTLGGIIQTYLWVGGYYLVTVLLYVFLRWAPRLAGWPGTWAWLTVGDISEWLENGNLIVLGLRYGPYLKGGQRLDLILAEMLGYYTVFHFLVAAVCGTWAVLRLRPVATKVATLTEKTFREPFAGQFTLNAWPMLWKETLLDARSRPRFWARLGIGMLATASFVPAFWFLGSWSLFGLSDRVRGPNLYAEQLNEWVALFGAGLGLVMLLRVAVRAATTISGERDRQTLEGLLTSPASSLSILLAKWVGSIVSPRRAWTWLLLAWFLAILSWALSPWAVVQFTAAWLIYAGLFAIVGMWFSLIFDTTQRSLMFTLLATVGAGFGHWLLYLAMTPRRDIPWLFQLHAYGLTPPGTLFGLSYFHGQMWEGTDGVAAHLRAAWTGLGLWLILTMMIGFFLMARFVRMYPRSARPPSRWHHE